MRETKNQKLWKFEFGSQEGMNIPIWSSMDFPRKDRQESQNSKNGIFFRLPVTGAQCIIPTEKYPDSSIKLNYDDDDDDDCNHVMVKSKELLELPQKMISFSHINQFMILDFQT